MDDDLQQKIAAALEQNVPMSDIAAHLASHENPGYSAYGKSLMESQAAPSTRRSDFQEPKKNLTGTITPVLDMINENPEAALAIGAAAVGIPYAIKTKNALEDRRMKRELHQSEIAKNAAYAKQVELQAQKLTTPAELTHTDVANMVKQERNVTGKPNPLAASFEEKFGMPLAQAEELSGGKITTPIDAEIIGNTLTKGQGLSVNPMPGTVSNQPAGIPNAVSPMDKLTQQPPTPQMIQPKPAAPTAVDTLAAGGTPTQVATQTVAQEIDAIAPTATVANKPVPPVYPKGETFKETPPGFVFRKDVGNLDRSLGNILGKEHREYARELFNEGKPFGHSADLNADVSKLTNQYWQKLQSEVPEALLGRDARRMQNIPSEFGTFAKKTNFGQKAKVAGVAGTLLAIADLANAKTPEEKTNAGLGLLGAILPPGMDINAAGAPGVSQSQVSNAALLGSPYAQTEWAKEQRLRERAGAGRGIMPPSAYQR